MLALAMFGLLISQIGFFYLSRKTENRVATILGLVIAIIIIIISIWD